MELHQKGWLKEYIQYALDENLFEAERPKIWSDKKLYPYLYHIFRQTGFFHGKEQSIFLDNKFHQNIQNHSEKNKLILLDLYLFFIKKKFPDKNLTKIIEDLGFYVHLIYQKELPNVMSFSKIEDVFEKYILKKELFSEDQTQGLYLIDLYFFLEYYHQSAADLLAARDLFIENFYSLLTFFKNQNPQKEREKLIQTLQKSLQNLTTFSLLEKEPHRIDFTPLQNNWILKKFTIEKIIFVYLLNNEEIDTEHPIYQLITKIDFSILELEESIIYVENFILTYQQETSNTGFFSKIYQDLTRRIKKEYYTHKKNILQEINESSELAELLKKSATTELNEEEKAKVKKQLLDIFKTIPAFAIFLLPGGAILLPILLKIIPKELLLPSSYYDGEEEEIK